MNHLDIQRFLRLRGLTEVEEEEKLRRRAVLERWRTEAEEEEKLRRRAVLERWRSMAIGLGRENIPIGLLSILPPTAAASVLGLSQQVAVDELQARQRSF